MKKAGLAIIAFLLTASLASPATVHLKNGRTISNVTNYYLKDGKYVLMISGGTFEIPSGDVANITGPVEELKPVTNAAAPDNAVSPAQKPLQKPSPPASDKGMMDEFYRMQARLAAVERKIADIEKIEAQIASEKTEYDRTRLVVERLFQKGRSEALKNGKSESQWISYLSAQEREWLQVNTMRKKELEPKIPVNDERLKELAVQKKPLLDEKAELEEKLEWYYH